MMDTPDQATPAPDQATPAPDQATAPAPVQLSGNLFLPTYAQQQAAVTAFVETLQQGLRAVGYRFLADLATGGIPFAGGAIMLTFNPNEER